MRPLRHDPSDMGVRPGMFASGREAVRLLVIWGLIATPLWVAVVIAMILSRWF